jgi:hypothetical protein
MNQSQIKKMILSVLFSILPILSLLGAVAQQQPFASNKGDLVGTWVSGSQGVITGPVSPQSRHF